MSLPTSDVILLVEDNPGDASLIRAELAAEFGDRIVWVQTFAEALAELAGRQVACVVLDLGLPDGEGLELVDGIQSARPDVPIVVLTGRQDADLAVEAVRHGAQDYLLKSELATSAVSRSVSYAVERAAFRTEIARKEAYYRSIIESLGEGLLVQDPEGVVVTANPEAARILDSTVGELVGRPAPEALRDVFNLRHSPLTDCTEPGCIASLTGEPVLGVTVGLDQPNGGTRWLELNATPLVGGITTPPYPVVLSLRDTTEKQATSERSRFQAGLLEAVGQAVVATDPTGSVVYWNPAAESLFGCSRTDAMGRGILDVVNLDEPEDRILAIAKGLAAGQRWSGELRATGGNGHVVPALVTVTPLLDASGAVTALIAVSTDLTERRRAEEVMRRLSAIVESTGDAIVGKSPEGLVVSWNHGAERLYGYTAEEIIGRHASILAPEESSDEVVAMLHRVAGGEMVDGYETVRRHKDGRLVDVSLTVSQVRGEHGELVGFSAISRDITARREAQRLVVHQALHDSLTNLPNRVLLADRLNQALARAGRSSRRVAVLFLDLDEFKLINDSLGHLAGDELLTQVAGRLLGQVRPDDTVARFGGDEFVVVCEVEDTDAAVGLGERLLRAMTTPFRVGGKDLFVTASIGVVAAEPGATGERLLQDADAAMYQAKERGRARLEVFTTRLHARAAQKLQTSTELRLALEQDQLRLHYQPIVSTQDGSLTAVEALVRWEHPERGLIPPDDFIPLAEETGMIVPMGMWVISQALRERHLWQVACPSMGDVPVSVNLSGRQLTEPSFVLEVANRLREAESEPSSLILEVTESMFMQGADYSLKFSALRDLGISLHVDDFGTGYSSLSYLKTLPVSALKIDRSFVSDLDSGSPDASIVAAVVALAKAMGLEVVAEGVETTEQLAVVRGLGCDYAQGFLLAGPMPWRQLVAWVRHRDETKAPLRDTSDIG